MLQFTVDDAQTVPIDNCVKCCCKSMSLKPGTSEKVEVDYASWSLWIGRLHCEPQFQLEQMETCPASAGANLPPRPAAKVAFDSPTGDQIQGDLKTQVTDPEGDPLTFKWVFMYGPNHGKLKLFENGTFEYTPDQGYTGSDRFYASVSDGVNSPVIFEVIIGVKIPSADIAGTPHVMVDRGGIQINHSLHKVYFPIRVSPAAQLCETWRLTVLQKAQDCECICYDHSDCFDIRIVKC